MRVTTCRRSCVPTPEQATNSGTSGRTFATEFATELGSTECHEAGWRTFRGGKSQPFRDLSGRDNACRDCHTRSRRSRRGPARPGGRDPAVIRINRAGQSANRHKTRAPPCFRRPRGQIGNFFPGRGGDGVARLSARRVPSGPAGLSISRRVIWRSDANACQPHDAPGRNRACGVRMGSAKKKPLSIRRIVLLSA